MSSEQIEELKDRLNILAVDMARLDERGKQTDKKLEELSQKFWWLINLQATTMVAVILLLLRTN